MNTTRVSRSNTNRLTFPYPWSHNVWQQNTYQLEHQEQIWPALEDSVNLYELVKTEQLKWYINVLLGFFKWCVLLSTSYKLKYIMNISEGTIHRAIQSYV